MVALPPLGNSPEGCGKLATFHGVARDAIPGIRPMMTSHPGGVPDIRPIPSHGSPLHQTPHLDSGHPKSTVDSGCQRLIWGDHALFHLPMPKRPPQNPSEFREFQRLFGIKPKSNQIRPENYFRPLIWVVWNPPRRHSRLSRRSRAKTSPRPRQVFPIASP
jgi:hypothetical protein